MRAGVLLLAIAGLAITSFKGSAGPEGSSGLQGQSGPTGPAGAQGVQGLPGTQRLVFVPGSASKRPPPRAVPHLAVTSLPH